MNSTMQKQSQIQWTLKADTTFKKLERLGSGSYGEVHKAVKEADARAYLSGQTVPLYAVKTFRDIGLDDMNREVRILMASRDQGKCHPSTICYADHYRGTPSQSFVLVSHYVSGQTMARLGQVTDVAKFRIIVQSLLEGLYYLHSKNIVHRDIKSDNIMIMNYQTLNPSAVYLDLGLGCQGEVDCLAQPRSVAIYKSPEQLEGRNLTLPEFKSSDVWFLAQAICYMSARVDVVFSQRLQALGGAVELNKRRRQVVASDEERARLEVTINKLKNDTIVELRSLHEKLVIYDATGVAHPTQIIQSIKDAVSRTIVIEMFRLKWKQRLLPLTGVMMIENEEYKMKKKTTT